MRGDSLKRFLRKTSSVLALAAATLLTTATSSWAIVTINVTTTDDVVNAGDGLTSLREAIQMANNGTDPEYVVNLVGGMTYTLSATPSLGDLEITRAGLTLTVSGNGGGLGQATIEGVPSVPAIDEGIFSIATPEFSSASINVTLNDLALTGSSRDGHGGVVEFIGDVFDVSQNDALTLNRCHVHTNDVSENGGGIFAFYVEEVTVNDSTFENNTASVGGAVSFVFGSLALNNSTLSGNSASQLGGGLFVGRADTTTSLLTIRNSTLYNNHADETGGGMTLINPQADIRNSIISGNTANNAPGMFGGPNCSVVNVSSPVIVSSHNVLGDFPTGCQPTSALGGDQNNVNAPMLAALGDNGGPTPTHALLIGSPAIDNGDPSDCTDSDGTILDYDQRGPGFPRADDGDNNGSAICDSGSFELPSTFSEIADAIEDLVDGVAALPPDVFSNGNKQAATLNKLDALEDMFLAIETETDPDVKAMLIADLEDKLVHDLRAKGDGCGLEPDNNDWIDDCDAQATYQLLIQDMLDLLEAL